jgi:hypothetical protein
MGDENAYASILNGRMEAERMVGKDKKVSMWMSSATTYEQETGYAPDTSRTIHRKSVPRYGS